MKVYIIQHGDNDETKIGIASDENRRLVELQTGTPRELTLIATIEFESNEVAFKFEHFLHFFFDAYRLNGEWFAVNPLDVIQVYDKFSELWALGLIELPQLKQHNEVKDPQEKNTFVMYHGKAVDNARQWLIDNPDKITLPLRELAELIPDAGKDSIGKARKQLQDEGLI